MISIWEKETFFAPQDIIIAGSGFVGLWSAYFLKKKNPELKITIIDRGIIPTGASTRNAGFACFGSLSELIHDIKTMGVDKTLSLVEMRYKGLERIQKHFDATQINFELCGGYELYDHTMNAEQLEEHIQYLNTLIKPITNAKKTYKKVDERIETFGFAQTTHLVKNNLEGYLHSGKLVQALLHRVQGMGVQVLNGITITEIIQKGKGVELLTNQSFHFKADQLLICTNAFAKDLLPEADVVPARGQVLVTSPIPNLPWRGTFHADEGFYYFRNLGDRVLLGGARNKAFEAETTTEMTPSDLIQSALEEYLQNTILPYY
ncbi:MAG TPA: FAD-dependent oxidoreductase, partial [Flavisolibacter sp.]|nr:FAD-dependent oxidoreductase [Flavisolibacter sp.]